MPALNNPKWEMFSRYLSEGWDASKAHEAAGYRGDRGNSSRLAKRPQIVGRVAELIAAKEAANPTDYDILTGTQSLRKLLKDNLGPGGNPQVAVSAARVIAEADGSLEELAPPANSLSDEELVVQIIPMLRDFARALGREVSNDKIHKAALIALRNPQALGWSA